LEKQALRPNEQKVLDFVKRSVGHCGDQRAGKGLLVMQFKYFLENIPALDCAPKQSAQVIQDTLEELDRDGQINLLAFIDGQGQYDNVVIQLPAAQ
jgi:hypothetical protein